MELRRLYFDTNVIISLGEGTDEIAGLLTELFGKQVPSEMPFLCTSELTLAEVLVKPYRERDDHLIRQYESWLVTGDMIEVGPVHRSVLQYAAVLRSQYRSIKLPDAIHVSTAIGFGCSHFLTGDLGLPDEIELFHEREGVRKGPAKLDLIRPTAEVLRSIIGACP
ncbi:MAG: PIN domain-containing protein [Rhizobiaceae bacterium]|nr:PIN domain-containing protein [Rhizobiaceae bacterium]